MAERILMSVCPPKGFMRKRRWERAAIVICDGGPLDGEYVYDSGDGDLLDFSGEFLRPKRSKDGWYTEAFQQGFAIVDCKETDYLLWRAVFSWKAGKDLEGFIQAHIVLYLERKARRKSRDENNS